MKITFQANTENFTIISRRELSEPIISKIKALAIEIINNPTSDVEIKREALLKLKERNIEIHSTTISNFLYQENPNKKDLARIDLINAFKSGRRNVYLELLEKFNANQLDNEIVNEALKLDDEVLNSTLARKIASLDDASLIESLLDTFFGRLNTDQIDYLSIRDPSTVNSLCKRIYLSDNENLEEIAFKYRPNGFLKYLFSECKSEELKIILDEHEFTESDVIDILEEKDPSPAVLENIKLFVKYHKNIIKNIISQPSESVSDTVYTSIIEALIQKKHLSWHKILRMGFINSPRLRMIISTALEKYPNEALSLYLQSERFILHNKEIDPDAMQHNLAVYLLNWIVNGENSSLLPQNLNLNRIAEEPLLKTEAEESHLNTEIQYVVDLLGKYSNNHFLRLPFYGYSTLGLTHELSFSSLVSEVFRRQLFNTTIYHSDPYAFSQKLFILAVQGGPKADRAKQVLQLMAKKDTQLEKFYQAIVVNNKIEYIDQLRASTKLPKQISAHEISKRNQELITDVLEPHYHSLAIPNLNKEGWNIKKILFPMSKSPLYEADLQRLLEVWQKSKATKDIPVEVVNSYFPFIRDIAFIDTNNRVLVPYLGTRNSNITEFIGKVALLPSKGDLNQELGLGVIEATKIDEIIEANRASFNQIIRTPVYFEGGNLIKAQNQEGRWITICGSHNILGSFCVLQKSGFFNDKQEVLNKIKERQEFLDSGALDESTIELTKKLLISSQPDLEKLTETELKQIAENTILKIEMIKEMFVETFGKDILFLGLGIGLNQKQIGFHLDFDIASAPNGVVFLNSYRLSSTMVDEILKTAKLTDMERYQLELFAQNLKVKLKLYDGIHESYLTGLKDAGFCVVEVPARFGTDNAPIVYTNMITGVKDGRTFALVPGYNAIPGESFLRDAYTFALKKGGIEDVYFIGHPYQSDLERPAMDALSHWFISKHGNLHCLTQVFRS